MGEHDRAMVTGPGIEPRRSAMAVGELRRRAGPQLSELILRSPHRCAVAVGASAPTGLVGDCGTSLEQTLRLLFGDVSRHEFQLAAARVEELTRAIETSGPGRVQPLPGGVAL